MHADFACNGCFGFCLVLGRKSIGRKRIESCTDAHESLVAFMLRLLSSCLVCDTAMNPLHTVVAHTVHPI